MLRSVPLIFIFSFLAMGSFADANEPIGVFSPTAWALAHDGHCFQQHLKEATEVNRSHGIQYAKHSSGKTNAISRLLVFYDRLGSLITPLVDSYANQFRSRSGVSILCEILPSMQIEPSEVKILPPVDFARFRKLPLETIIPDLKRALREENWKAIIAISEQYQPYAAVEARFNCIGLHFLRTMKRLAEIVPEHSDPDVEGFAKSLIRGSILMLRQVSKIDEKAAPFQAAGLPILCAEIPAVPSF